MSDRGEEILDVFSTLAARYGLSKTTLKDVAREAGVSVGTIYNDFADKEALIFAFWQRMEERCIRRLDELAAGGLPSEELLRRLILEHIRAFNELLRGNRGVYELMTGSAISYIGKTMLGRRQIIQRELTARVEEVLRAGALAGVFEVAGDFSEAALRFVEAFTEYTAPPLMLVREPEEVLKDAASMFAFVIRAVRKDKGAGSAPDAGRVRKG